MQTEFYSYLSNLEVFCFYVLPNAAKSSSIVLNGRSEIGHVCFISDLRGKVFTFSQLSMFLAMDLLYMAFIMLRYISFTSNFLTWKEAEFCQIQIFLHLLRWLNNFYLSFLLVSMQIDWFVETESFLHCRDKSHLIMVYNLSNVLLISICRICGGFLHLCSSEILACNFLFLQCLWLTLISG